MTPAPWRQNEPRPPAGRCVMTVCARVAFFAGGVDRSAAGAAPDDDMADLVKHLPTSPSRPDAGSSTPKSTPGKLTYNRSTTITGWDDLPIAVRPPRGAVWQTAQSVTVRRDGQTIQRVTGAALGADALAIVEQVRPLTPSGDGRVRPDGKWALPRCEARPITGLARMRRTSPGPAGADNGPEPGDRAADSVVDSLPADVQALLGSAAPLLATAYLRDDGSEDISVLVVGAQVIAVACHRIYGQIAGDLEVWRAAPAGTSGELSGGRPRRVLSRKPRLPMLGS